MVSKVYLVYNILIWAKRNKHVFAEREWHIADVWKTLRKNQYVNYNDFKRSREGNRIYEECRKGGHFWNQLHANYYARSTWPK